MSDKNESILGIWATQVYGWDFVMFIISIIQYVQIAYV